MDWGTKRKLMITGGFLAIVIVLGIFWYFANVYQSPTCTDGIQNQGEQGTDCGGPCRVACALSVAKPTVLWSRSFEILPGFYNAVAYIENPNPGLGVKQAIYKFKFYDDHNVLVTERDGTVFIMPNERFAVFEPRIATQNRIVKHTYFEFVSFSDWTKVKNNNAGLTVRDEKAVNTDTLPRVNATLSNSTLFDIPDIIVVTIVYDRDENAIAASATSVENLPQRSSVKLVFTWPKPFPSQATRVEVIPRQNIFEATN